MVTASEAFARVVIALEPYAAQVVFVGGWVHALFLAEAGATEGAVITDDIDVTLPPLLLTEGRPRLVELASSAGFEIDPMSALDGASMRLTIPGPGDSLIDLDLLTEAEQPGVAVVIDGQGGLRAQGYPWQAIALENSRWISVGTDIHETLDPPRKIRVPTIGAYILHKGLSSITRTRLKKEAKDLVYLHEILRHPSLGQLAVEGLPDLAARYPSAYAGWWGRVAGVSRNSRLLREIADQLLVGGRAQGDPGNVVAAVTARLRRTLAEAPTPGGEADAPG